MSFGGLTNQTSPSVSINGSPFFQQIPSYNIIDNVTKVLGKHTIKTGIYYYKATAFNTPQSPAQASVDYYDQPGNQLRTSRLTRVILSPTRCSASSQVTLRQVKRSRPTRCTTR